MMKKTPEKYDVKVCSSAKMCRLQGKVLVDFIMLINDILAE